MRRWDLVREQSGAELTLTWEPNPGSSYGNLLFSSGGELTQLTEADAERFVAWLTGT